jgi:hypothetical protein
MNAQVQAGSLAANSSSIPWPCDVCGSSALISGAVDDFGSEVHEPDGNGFVDAVWKPLIVLLPRWFACSICGVVYPPWELGLIDVPKAIPSDMDPGVAYEIMQRASSEEGDAD